MIVLGLTGSIGMGKTTATRVFRRLGVPVHDADALVHRLLGPGGGAVAEVERAFPGVSRGDAIPHQALARRVFGNDIAFKILESILHPLVKHEQRRFISICRRRREPVVVLDVPLLFETGSEGLCDAVVVVSAPEWMQEQRVLARPGMTRERLAAIRARQLPDLEKRRRSDFVVLTGLGYRESYKAILSVVKTARGMAHA